jgi:hypothetical protein
MEDTGIVKKTVELNAIVYPACVCGKPWAAHGACGGYKPSRSIEDYGTVFFKSKDRIANFLFKIEQFIQRMRRARMRSL